MRLIDADALIQKAVVTFYTTNYFSHITKMIDDAPTVRPEETQWIPARDENGKSDLISRKVVIEALRNHYEVNNAVQNSTMDECVMLVKNIPSAGRYSKWSKEFLLSTSGGTYAVFRCLKCSMASQWPTTYCPSCGAKMEVDE